MDYKLSETYVNTLINRVFAVLGVFEDSVQKSNYDNFSSYLDRVCTEIYGCYVNTSNDKFLSIYNLLTGIQKEALHTHKHIKSIVFHCISMIKQI